MRFRHAFSVVAAAALLVVGAHQALGGGRPFHVTLDGAAEAQGADPDGAGTAVITVNPGTGTIEFTLTVENIAPATAAHIHNAAAGTNGPVVVPLVAPTSGSSSGMIEVDRELALDIIRHPENYYVNVHNAEYPGGAVRGQLSH